MANAPVLDTRGLPMKTQEAFAGINYMESLGGSSEKGRAAIKEFDKNMDWSQVLQPDVSSIFNKFTVFQYSGLYAGGVYQIGGHFIGHADDLKTPDNYSSQQASVELLKTLKLQDAESSGLGQKAQRVKDELAKWERSSADRIKAARNFKKNSEGILSNPTANRLVKWGAEISPGTVLGFQPYSHTDFMYCTHYGKVPNNRLVTLRRYPYPISDSLKLSRQDSTKNAIPIAQAVTWFGSDTGNDLNKLGLFSWDMPWEKVEVSEQEITGNEVTLSDLLKVVSGPSIPGGAALAGFLEASYAAIEGSDASAQQVSGYDEKIQQYQKALYTTGPYWNRIYGPVNVIHESSRRSRGIQTKWQTEMTINFSYKFRSFNGLSPKIAALDLISNFINLTYNDAQFLGQLARYYPKTGLKFNPTVTEALGKILTSWGTTYSGNNSKQFNEILEGMFKAMELAGSKILSDPAKVIGDGIQTAAAIKLSAAIPNLISVKSALSDRPVGEWHLVVGNPMNPIFVMGDLICSEVSMVWDTELGPDDFPTGVSFQVSLKQGKPRDKTAIERMLNLGQTKLTTGTVRGSTTTDTFGEDNNQNWNNIYGPTGQAKGKGTNLEQLKGELLKTEAQNKRYDGFKDRVLKGYGIRQNDKTKLDDSLLLLYYARQYGKT